MRSPTPGPRATTVPLARRFDRAKTMITTPIVETSSIDNFPRVRHSRATRALGSRQRAAASSVSTCSSGTTSTNTAYMAKAMALLALPCASQSPKLAMQEKMLTSLLSKAGRFCLLMATANGFSAGLCAYNKFMSRRKVMQGVTMPKPKSTTKARDKKTAVVQRSHRRRSTALAGIAGIPVSAMGPQAAVSDPSSEPSSGNARPKDARVDRAQKTQKHVKPRPRSASLVSFGGLSRLRKSAVIKT
mmetsp:Transcript_42262/g.119521  ORF Transcript_42262/g.119521 Transcript_42262/m.119521 type:complete len:245 (-) Transcript_42262:590-1324(-)